MSDQNKAAVRRFVEEVWNRGNMDAIDELVAEDCQSHDPLMSAKGTAGVREFVGTFRTAFPDLKFEIDDLLVDGDKVVARWTASGTHTGPLVGVGLPATGKRATVGGQTIDRFSGGKIAESWHQWDALGLLRQLGILG